MSSTLAEFPDLGGDQTEINRPIQKGGAPYSGGNFMGAPFIDVNNKTRSPNAFELIRENLATAYACADLNAQLVATTPLRLYVKTTKRRRKSWLKERGETKAISLKTAKWFKSQPHTCKMMSDAEDVEEVTSHPLLDLLQHPIGTNEDDSVGISEYTMFETIQAYQEVVGRAYLYKERGGLGGRQITSLWILGPHLTQEMPSVGGKRIIEKYYFMSPFGKQEYDPSEIVPFRMQDLYTAGYMGGMSPLRACIEQIKLKRQLDANSISLLQNGGKPSAMYIPKGNSNGDGIGAEEAERIAKAFRMAFSRAGQGGILVGEFPGSLEIFQWPTREIVDMAQYGMTKSDICNAFSIPTTLLDRRDANLASSKTGDYAHAKYAGLPRLRRNEAALNMFLVSEYDPAPQNERQLFLAYDKPQGLDSLSDEFEQTRNAQNVGAASSNEVRLSLDLEPVEGGDIRFISKNMVPLDPVTGKRKYGRCRRNRTVNR